METNMVVKNCLSIECCDARSKSLGKRGYYSNAPKTVPIGTNNCPQCGEPLVMKKVYRTGFIRDEKKQTFF